MKKALIASVVIALVIFGTSQILFQEMNETAEKSVFLSRGLYFNWKLAWIEFLVVSSFISTVFAFKKIEKKAKDRVEGGTIPAMFGVIPNVSVLLLLLLGFFTFVLKDQYMHIYATLSIASILVGFIVVYFMSGASRMQQIGAEEIKTNIKKPEELVAYLTVCERQKNLSSDFYSAIRKCIRLLSYSIPRVGNIASSELYISIVKDVESIYSNMQDAQIENIVSQLEDLELKIQELTLSLKH